MSADFVAWPKIPRIENEVLTFTEKIDGTNACIVIGDDRILSTQSRTRIIIPGDDNFGFAKWAYENEAALVEQLGPGRWFGEWWGQGIQRGYDQQKKKFSLFYFHHDRSRLDPELVDVVPVLPVSTVDDAREYLKVNGSIAAPGWMRPEGAVVYNKLTQTRYKIIIDK